MWNRKKSVTLSLVVCFVFAAFLFALLFLMPKCLAYYYLGVRRYAPDNGYLQIRQTVLFCFYPCAVFAGGALYALIRLLLRIRAGQLFVAANVRYLFAISWCCYAVALITLIGGIRYLPLLIIAVAASFVGLIMRVVKNVMQTAVELREDNDLTI